MTADLALVGGLVTLALAVAIAAQLDRYVIVERKRKHISLQVQRAFFGIGWFDDELFCLMRFIVGESNGPLVTLLLVQVAKASICIGFARE